MQSRSSRATRVLSARHMLDGRIILPPDVHVARGLCRTRGLSNVYEVSFSSTLFTLPGNGGWTFAIVPHGDRRHRRVGPDVPGTEPMRSAHLTLSVPT